MFVGALSGPQAKGATPLFNAGMPAVNDWSLGKTSPVDWFKPAVCDFVFILGRMIWAKVTSS